MDSNTVIEAMVAARKPGATTQQKALATRLANRYLQERGGNRKGNLAALKAHATRRLGRR